MSDNVNTVSRRRLWHLHTNFKYSEYVAYMRLSFLNNQLSHALCNAAQLILKPYLDPEVVRQAGLKYITVGCFVILRCTRLGFVQLFCCNWQQGSVGTGQVFCYHMEPKLVVSSLRGWIFLDGLVAQVVGDHPGCIPLLPFLE